ncbi:hypothetical protein I5M86_00105 [Serratia marcescens]|nr:hypothetical protein [Serratia marcescens]MBH3063785.1 hypothetical protein [Serratia marcescens]
MLLRGGIRLLLVALGVGMSAGAQATSVFYPQDNAHVVCDRTAGFCADAQGISLGLTAHYLGTTAQKKLQLTLGQAAPVHLGRFTLSDGRYCNREAQGCYRGRHDSAPDIALTQRLFGRAAQTTSLAVFFPAGTTAVVCDRQAGFCADRQGISLGLTAAHLGDDAQQQLQQTLSQVSGANLKRYTLSNGVTCDSAQQACFADKAETRRDDAMTRSLFGQEK